MTILNKKKHRGVREKDMLPHETTKASERSEPTSGRHQYGST
jgi:hypothetical protein